MDMLRDKTGPMYVRCLLPGLITGISLSVFTMVDMYFVGQYVGADGMAAFSVVTPLLGVVSFLGVFVGVGGAVTMGVARGQGDEDRSNALFTCSLLLLALLTALIWGFFLLFTEEIYRFFGANQRLLPYVADYADWYILSFPFFFFAIYAAFILRCDGAPGLASLAVIVGGLFNVAGDWYLVAVRDMGMAGAAIATVLGNLIQSLIFLAYFFSRRCTLRLKKPRRLSRGLYQVAGAGFSAGFIDIAYILLTILLNNLVLHYGNEVDLAVFGVAYNCSTMFMRVFNGVGKGVQPIISTNYGAGQPGRILEILRLSLWTELVLSLLLTSLGLLFPVGIVLFFVEYSPAVAAASPGIMRPFFLTNLFLSFGMFSTYYFQSIVRSGLATLIALLRGILVSGLFSVLLPLVLGLSGIWWGMVLGEGLVAAFAMLMILRSRPWLNTYVRE